MRRTRTKTRPPRNPPHLRRFRRKTMWQLLQLLPVDLPARWPSCTSRAGRRFGPRTCRRQASTFWTVRRRGAKSKLPPNSASTPLSTGAARGSELCCACAPSRMTSAPSTLGDVSEQAGCPEALARGHASLPPLPRQHLGLRPPLPLRESHRSPGDREAPAGQAGEAPRPWPVGRLQLLQWPAGPRHEHPHEGASARRRSVLTQLPHDPLKTLTITLDRIQIADRNIGDWSMAVILCSTRSDSDGTLKPS